MEGATIHPTIRSAIIAVHLRRTLRCEVLLMGPLTFYETHFQHRAARMFERSRP